jgi:hypothetical protein
MLVCGSYLFLVILELIYRDFNIIILYFPPRALLLTIGHILLYNFLVQLTPVDKLIQFPQLHSMLPFVLFNIAGGVSSYGFSYTKAVFKFPVKEIFYILIHCLKNLN